MIPCLNTETFSLTPNAVIWSMQISTHIADGELKKSMIITLQRAHKSTEGVWTADSRQGASRHIPIGDLDAFLAEHPAFAPQAAVVWQGLAGIVEANPAMGPLRSSLIATLTGAGVPLPIIAGLDKGLDGIIEALNTDATIGPQL